MSRNEDLVGFRLAAHVKDRIHQTTIEKGGNNISPQEKEKRRKKKGKKTKEREGKRERKRKRENKREGAGRSGQGTTC